MTKVAMLVGLFAEAGLPSKLLEDILIRYARTGVWSLRDGEVIVTDETAGLIEKYIDVE